MFYFTSDIHFDDCRDFQLRIVLRRNLDPTWDNEKNNQFIIDSWNKIVKPEDTVVIVGDVSITKEGYENVKKLNGTKILVKGNYDEDYDEEFLLQYFKSVHENLYIKEDNLFITHKPTDYREGANNVVGHIHGLWRVQEGIINVSFEAWENQPISKELLLRTFDVMDKFYDDEVFVGRKLYKK